MALGPFVSEQIHDPQFEELVEHICHRPQMFVHPTTLGTVCAYLDGFNSGRDGGPLLGLREWLVLRVDGWNNLPWSGLAYLVLSGDHSAPASSDDREVLAALGQLLREYLAYRPDRGLSNIFFDYAVWMRSQDWYSGPLLSEGESSA